MAIKIKLTDGTVFEGTAEEIAELQKLLVYKNGAKPKYKTVDRPAKVGERILITKKSPLEDRYDNGDIFEVKEERSDGSVRVEIEGGRVVLVLRYEYEVIIEEENGDKLKMYDARGNEIKEGDRVKLQVKDKPRHGWGDVSNGEIGTVDYITDEKEVIVNFPSNSHWYALPNELINLSAEPSFGLSVGDYAKVTGLTFFGDITEGSYVKIVEDIDYDGEHKIELIDGSEYDYTKPEALEKVELTDRELTFLKAGREPGEFKVGDLVEVIDIHHIFPKNSIVEIVKKYFDGDVLTKGSDGTISHLTKPKHLKLIAPVEARVDR